jgi:hypothetical protein
LAHFCRHISVSPNSLVTKWHCGGGGAEELGARGPVHCPFTVLSHDVSHTQHATSLAPPTGSVCCSYPLCPSLNQQVRSMLSVGGCGGGTAALDRVGMECSEWCTVPGGRRDRHVRVGGGMRGQSQLALRAHCHACSCSLSTCCALSPGQGGGGNQENGGGMIERCIMGRTW